MNNKWLCEVRSILKTKVKNKKMSDIFINSEISRPPRPEHGNNCNGHFTSIANGGNGHSIGDGCGCDGMNPEASIDFIIPILLISAITIIYLKIKTKL